jgi:hypothetical protein
MNPIVTGSQMVDRLRGGLRLLAAIRFQDAFTKEQVRVPLRVSVPQLRLKGIYHAGSGVYSLAASGVSLPSGTFPLVAEAPGEEYVLWEPHPLVLPLTSAAATLRERFLVDVPIHPTRRLRMRPGETTVVGRILRSASLAQTQDLQVQLIRQAPLLSLETRTLGSGEFFFRVPLPELAGGGTSVSPESVRFEVRTPQGMPLTAAGGQAEMITPAQANFVQFVL